MVKEKFKEYFKIRIFSLLFILLFFVTILSSKKSLAFCSPPCPSGTYECQYGTMCCTGGGCPTWECANTNYFVRRNPTTGTYECGYFDDGIFK